GGRAGRRPAARRSTASDGDACGSRTAEFRPPARRPEEQRRRRPHAGCEREPEEAVRDRQIRRRNVSGQDKEEDRSGGGRREVTVEGAAEEVTNPTTPVAPAASHASREQSVPSAISTTPTAARARYATRRVRHRPPNSTSTSTANDPNAAKSDVCGFPMT